MSMSLRDQLLQVGLISQKQAKEAERQADRQAEQHRHQHSKQKHPKHKGAAPASKTAPTNSSTPKTTTTPAVMTSSAPAAVPAPARPVPAHASAQAAKVARDQALSRKQQEKAQKKALQ